MSRHPRLQDMPAAPWPAQTHQQRAAEALAIQFGLGHLSAEGIAKLAQLLTWVQPARWEPPPERVV